MSIPVRPLVAAVWLLLALAGCGSDGAGTGGAEGADASTGGTEGDDRTASGRGSAMAALCVKTINDYRQTVGAPALERWTDGEACADEQCESDSQTKKAHGAFGRCGELAQDECPGWDGDDEKAIPACLEMMWKEGPGGGHYDNMSNTKYTKVACGVYRTESGKLWAIQNFK